MTQRIFVDRSRYETYGRCPRARYLEYHFGGQGITSSRKPLPLAVGGSVHEGLASLLRGSQAAIDKWGSVAAVQMETWRNIEEEAVRVALADFAEYQNMLDPPDAEQAALATPTKLAEGMIGASAILNETQLDVIEHSIAMRCSEFDEYLYAEQSALVEAMVRAYSRRRLLPLLEQFEVLEVEREGEWLLSEWRANPQRISTGEEFPRDTRTEYDDMELWFMSRPDALLRERESNQLYLLSFKTAASWDVRKARDAEHDMQGMSEGVEIERRLGQWWDVIQQAKETHTPVGMGHYADCSPAMQRYLFVLDAPPRILAVRYEYMLKGERWKDKELSERFGVEMRSQKSHLIRRYEAVSVPMRGSAGYNIGDSCWAWDYIRDDGRESSLAWQNWKSRPVWESSTVREWIDKLDDAAPAMSGEDSTMGLEPRMLGYKCDAQAVGVTREHPLDAIFIPPIVVYRNEDELRDMVDQLEATERRIAEGVAAVNGAGDASEIRHALNVHFPQTRRACEYPTTCQFSKVCYGGEDIRHDPLASGLYKVRVANHPQENPR